MSRFAKRKWQTVRPLHRWTAWPEAVLFFSFQFAGSQPKTLFHTVVAIDDHTAQILQFGQKALHARKVKAHSQHNEQRGSNVGTKHKFFGEACDALADISEVRSPALARASTISSPTQIRTAQKRPSS